MTRIKVKSKLWYWPLTEKQYLKWQKPGNILLRLKIVSTIIVALSAYFFIVMRRADLATAFLLAAMGTIIYGYYFYKAVKSGKISFKKQ